MLDKFTLKAQEVVLQAQNIAREFGHQQVEVEHLVKALLSDQEGIPLAILKKIGANVGLIIDRFDEEIRKLPKVSGAGALGSLYVSPQVNRVFNNAIKEMRQLKDEFISTEHLFLAMVDDQNCAIAGMLKNEGIDKNSVYQVLKEIRGTQRVVDQNPEDKYQALKRFGRDLTELANRGKLDPVIGRDEDRKSVV